MDTSVPRVAPALLLAFTGLVGASGLPEPSIFGTITEAATGAPIKGAVVTVASENPPTVVSAISSPDGKFRISDLPLGRFYLTGSKQGFLETTYGSSWRGEPGVRILLTSDQPTREITVSLQRSSVLFGEVRDGRDRPAAGASITVYRVSQLGSSRHAEKLREVRCDDRGQYRVFGLEAGAFVIAVKSANSSAGGRAEISDQRVDLLLQALREGRRTAQPIEDRPSANGQDSAELLPVFFPGGSAGAPVGSIDLAFGEERRLDVTIPAVWTGSISGTVLGLSPGKTAFVVLQPRLDFDAGPSGQRGPSTSTAADGTFVFRAVSPGAYIVSARVEGDAADKGQMMWGRNVVEVGGGQSARVVVGLHSGITVSGRVVALEGSEFPAVLSGMSVQLLGVDGRTSLPPLRAPVDSRGRFEFQNTPPGAYRAAVSIGTANDGAKWVAESAACAGVDAIDLPCDLAGLGNDELVVRMTTSTSGVVGRLDSGEGLVPSSFLAVAFSTSETDWIPGSRRVKVIRVAPDGEFSVDLPSGAYYLGVVTSTVIAQATSPDLLSQLKKSSVTVVVQRGQIVRQDLKVSR